MARPLVIAERVVAHPERRGAKKRGRSSLIVLHTTEGGEGASAAEALASQCTRPGDRPRPHGPGMYGSSYHWVVDTDRVIPIVPEDTVAFSAAGANEEGIHIVFPGRASQTREQWLDGTTDAYLEQCARLMVDINARTGIPLVRLSVREVQARASGYIDHGDVSAAFGLTDHTDVGDEFPWDELERRIVAERAAPGRAPAAPRVAAVPATVVARPVPSRPHPTQDHDQPRRDVLDMLPIITNQQALGRVPPNVIKWALMDDGSLRALDPGEWAARGSLEGVPWDNEQLQRHGVDVAADVHR